MTGLPLLQITQFKYEWDFLSNFHPSVVEMDGVKYASVEHAYQAAKTLDPAKREVFSLEFNPRLTAAQSKRMGRRLKLRENWDTIKNGIMRGLLVKKFSAGPLRTKLLGTGNAELVEGNWWHDTHFGVCYGRQAGRECDFAPHEPTGANWLGRLLMEVRSEITPPAVPEQAAA
jgi:N-glycosidase YbiA